MTEAIKAPVVSRSVPPFVAVALAWIVPGSGHFLLGRPMRGLLIMTCVAVMFLLGIVMRGAFFRPQSGDILTMIIYCGGYAAHVATGALYFIAEFLNYNQLDVAGHMHDYGAKFLVGAGMLNVLGMVDVWEIATGQKD